jgi:lipoyl(octanoyl) transferase
MKVVSWGEVSYQEAYLRQKKLVTEVAAGAQDVVILCEHPRTITLGRKTKEENLLLPRAMLEEMKFHVVAIDRGGDVTLHAPGQLVVYPIINLSRAKQGLKGYLQNLEQVAVDLLSDFGIVARGDDSFRGVWVGSRKIASIGIGLSRWVTYHGLALNVTNDLSDFNVMRPCGLDVRMTSVLREKQELIVFNDVLQRASQYFRRWNG